MKKVVQINVCSNWGSTGHIAESCNAAARGRGYLTYFAYGRSKNTSSSTLIKIGNIFDVYMHYLEHRILCNEGLASKSSTYKLLNNIENISPDVIHLHNLHDHYINYQILFKYLNQSNAKIVWTFHDFWPITGYCCHFSILGCEKWKTKCERCPMMEGKLLPLVKKVEEHYELKRELFTSNRNLHIVAVSKWVENQIRCSFLRNVDIRTITNGINLNIYRQGKKRLGDNIPKGAYLILAVASRWTRDNGKGLKDYLSMSRLLKDDEYIVLVGVNNIIKNILPDKIIGIERIESQELLANYYTKADVVTCLSTAETFGLTVIEANACGTPVVVYGNTALTSLVNQFTGLVVSNGDYDAAYAAIQTIRKRGKKSYSDACKNWAKNFDEVKSMEQYVDLYDE